jgi:hypothetical protein
MALMLLLWYVDYHHFGLMGELVRELNWASWEMEGCCERGRVEADERNSTLQQ